jgi:peptide chain release factor
MKKEEVHILITSAQGPEECELGAWHVLKDFMHEAIRAKIRNDIVQYVAGENPNTVKSAIVQLRGTDIATFLHSWTGTIQWIVESPYRKYHKRKNWFIGVFVIEKPEEVEWNHNDVRFETMRASGAGGQHVNKTESAVRAIHIPTGINVTVSESRSQHENRVTAAKWLKQKVEEDYLLQMLKQKKKTGISITRLIAEMRYVRM